MLTPLQIESARLSALRALSLIGTEPEPHFDAVCRTAQALFSVPITLVSLVEEHEQWFKARCGLDVEGTSRAVSFCAHAILADDVFVIEDATRDARFCDNSLVTGAPGIRFYAGAPIALRPGVRVGTLCLIDTCSRSFSVEEAQQLQDLAAIVVAHLRLHETLRVSEALRAEHHRTEAVLTASETNYRLLVEGVQDHAIYMLDPSGLVKNWNAGALRIKGFNASEIVGSHISRFYTEEDQRQGIPEAALRTAEHLGVYRNEGWRVRKGGERFWANVVIHAIRNAAGTLLGFTKITRDATDRWAAETALRASEARYRLLAENTSDVIIQCDLDTARRYVSPAAYAVLGYAPDELIGTHPIDFVHPDDVTDYQSILDDLGQGRVGRAVSEQRYRHKDGRWVWIEASFTLTRDAETGQPTGYIASLRDVTDRKAAEHAAAASEARYREVQDAAHDAILAQLAEGVIVTDASGRITLVNEAAAMIHGVGRLDVAPDAYSDTYHLFTDAGEPYPPMDLPLARAVRGETVRDARWRVRRPDGSEILAIGDARPLLGRDGGQIGAVLTLRDDTAREGSERALRVSEAALRELNATLSERVEARTRDAKVAKVTAERASAAKTDFLAVMSHEIRTPLNAIIGFTDMMVSSGRLPPDLQHQAQLVRISGSALLTVVNDILDFSKVEAGAIELERKPFAALSLLDSCLSIVRGSATAKGIELRSQIDPTLSPGLLGDAARLRQILLNLLNNAIKFTHTGTVTLSVRQERTHADGRTLLFSVIDTGIGIPADKQDRLFQHFSQVDGSIQRDFGGTGLGLAICKRLIGLMDGEIGVSSENGLGSTFWFSLTLPSASLGDHLAPVITEAPARRCGRLLLVEDVAINQELARAVLEAAGHSVDVVDDGAAAIVAVVENTYDLVLMDVQMPGMDGLTATRMIRRLKGPSARVPIIAMTANVLPDQVSEFRAAGMDDHIGKPFERAALYASLDRWLADRPEMAQVADLEPVLDRAVYEEAARMLTPARMGEVLVLLVEQMEESFADPSRRSSDRDRLRFEAHALRSASGMIGLTELSASCQALDAYTEERVAQNGVEEFQRSLARLRKQTTDAVRYVRRHLDNRHSCLQQRQPGCLPPLDGLKISASA